MSNYPTFIPGQTVRTCYGEICTVLFQRGPQVFVVEGDWYHSTKLSPILLG
jgi:hypothetical protein